MRFLLGFAGGAGHFRPLLPLARALAARGHDILFAAQQGMLAAVRAEGFAATESGGDTLLAAEARRPLLTLDPAREERAVTQGYAGRVAAARAPAIAALIAAWRPDALLCDEMDFGAMLAAEQAGLPRAVLGVIAAGRLSRPALLAPALAPLRAALGLPPAPDAPPLWLNPFPPALRDPDCPLPAGALSFRPDAPPASPPPPWLEALPQPLLHLTLGTVFNQESGDLLSRMLAALRGLPAGAVLATGPQIDPAELGAPPPGVRVERFVDQAMLLPRCALAVCHAGSGTVAASLAAGVPLLLLPMGADQPDNAARCVALGVAEALDPLAATQGALHQAMQRLLRSAPHRAAARRLAAGFAALPGQETALARLEALARRAA